MNRREGLAARYEAALRQRAGAALPAIGYHTLRDRVGRGWTPQQAIEVPVATAPPSTRDRDQRVLRILTSSGAVIPSEGRDPGGREPDAGVAGR